MRLVSDSNAQLLCSPPPPLGLELLLALPDPFESAPSPALFTCCAVASTASIKINTTDVLIRIVETFFLYPEFTHHRMSRVEADVECASVSTASDATIDEDGIVDEEFGDAIMLHDIEAPYPAHTHTLESRHLDPWKSRLLSKCLPYVYVLVIVLALIITVLILPWLANLRPEDLEPPAPEISPRKSIMSTSTMHPTTTR